MAANTGVMRGVRWLAAVMIFGGVFLWTVAAGHFGKANRLRRDGVEVAGVVASAGRVRAYRGWRHAAWVEFRDNAGATRRFEASTRDAYAPGNAVRVVYVPDDPAVADIAGAPDTELWRGGAGFAAGLFFLAMGAYFVWRGFARTAPKDS